MSLPKMPPSPLHWAGLLSVGVPANVTAEQFADALDYARHWDLAVIWSQHNRLFKETH